MSERYITLNDVEVEEITVKVSIDEVLTEASEAQLIEALKALDYDGAAFLEEADADALFEALGDKDESDLIDLLEEHNALEAATRRWLDALSDDDRHDFLLRASYVTDPTPIPELVFVADSPTAPVHWVQDVSSAPGKPCGMILPNRLDMILGRASLRMFINTNDDTGWIDCESMPIAQRLAGFLHAGRAAMEARKGKECPLCAPAPDASAADPHGAGPCTWCEELQQGSAS